MSLTRRIAGHSLHYGTAQILIMGSGVISMPIFTRVMSKAEYGMMSIIGITLLLGMNIFSGCVRQSYIRHYGEFRAKGTLASSLSTYLTCVWVLGLAGMIATALGFWALAAWNLMPNWALRPALTASPLVFLRLSFAGVACIYMMREQVVRYNLFDVSNKYIGMGLCLLFVLLSPHHLQQYYRGLFLGEILVFAVLCWTVLRREGRQNLTFSRDQASELFRYGLPLMLGGLAIHIFGSADRYLIGWFLGPEKVAEYSVGWQLATYTCKAVVGGFEFALIPVVMNAWNAGNREQAETTLRNLVRYFSLAAFPIAAGLIAVRTDLIHLIASDKYLAAARVMPLIVGVALMQGYFNPLVMGLHFAKKTGVIAILCFSIAGLNILLNCILIPMQGPFGGVIGAATAAFVSFALYIVIGHLLARRYYTLAIPWRQLGQYALAAVLMFLCVSSITLQNWVVQLAVRVATGVVVYVVLILAIDRPLRSYVADHLHRRKEV